MKVKSPWLESLFRLKRPDLKEEGLIIEAKKTRKLVGGRTRLVAHAAGRELKKLLRDAIKVARRFNQEGSLGPYEEQDQRSDNEDSESEEVVHAATFKKRPMITVCVYTGTRS